MNPYEDMTLGQAVSMLRRQREYPIGCACVGGDLCCVNRFTQARALQRAAHIVARLAADAEKGLSNMQEKDRFEENVHYLILPFDYFFGPVAYRSYCLRCEYESEPKGLTPNDARRCVLDHLAAKH